MNLRTHKRRACAGMERRFRLGREDFGRRPLAIGWRVAGWLSCVWMTRRPG